MNAGAYILARFDDPDKLIPAIDRLKTCEQVQRWNAIDGNANIIIKTKTPSTAIPEVIEKIDGIVELSSYDILTDGEQEILFDKKYCHTYLLIECEPSKSEKLKNTIQAIDGCLFTSKVSSGCDIITVIRGENFHASDMIINDRIRILDGIIRMKTNRVINLNQI